MTIKADQRPGTRGGSPAPAPPPATGGPHRRPVHLVARSPSTWGVSGHAYRYHRERTSSGAQTGSERSDVWFSAATGMPLRNERRLEVRTSTVIGEVTYTEDAEFSLSSIQPET